MTTIRTINGANGGLVSSDETEWKVLRAQAVATGNYESFACLGTDPYIVTAAKILYISKICFATDTAGAKLEFTYGTDNGTNVPADVVKITAKFFTGAGNTQYKEPVIMAIPAGKSIQILSTGGTVEVTIFGIEK